MHTVVGDDILQTWLLRESAFYSTAATDNRLGSVHISLYMALVHFWILNNFQNPVEITRHELMPLAKINARATYHKAIKELHEYGYIRYFPSNVPFSKSKIFLHEYEAV